MHVHHDYEPEDILAAFDSPHRAREAARRIKDIVHDERAVVVVPLEPGRYAVVDRRLSEEARGALRGIRLGLPLGSLVGLGLGTALTGVGPFALAAFAAAGGFTGLVVGGITGAIARTRWDRDPAHVVVVPDGAEYALVIVHASAAPGPREAGRVMRELERAGTLGFLDPTAFYARYPMIGGQVAG